MFDINFNSNAPIYMEIANNIIKLIITGVYKEHDKLPSIRELSNFLSINHNTIQKAYVELEQKGYVYSKTGLGMFVSENIDRLNDKEINNMLKNLEFDLLELKKLNIDVDVINKVIEQVFIK